MPHDSWFDTDENKALIAICARKLISNIGIGGIVWGAINLLIGAFAILDNPINAGILILGVVMLGAGIQALRNPTLGVLLTETIVTGLLFVWNLGISILNSLTGGGIEPRGLIFPLVIAVVFINYYRKLGPLREQIASVAPEKIKSTKQVCKTLLKKKLKEEPSVVQTNDSRCRAQLMENLAFFVQRDLMRAFVVSKEDLRRTVVDPEAKKLKMKFNHPLGALVYQFDKGSSEKLRAWFGKGTEPAAETAA
jgi:hypothetical protein